MAIFRNAKWSKKLKRNSSDEKLIENERANEYIIECNKD